MLRNYFTVTCRNLWKNKAFSCINISGLALGMSACLVILQYAGFELSYDTFHTQVDRIYRVRMDVSVDGNLQISIPKNANAAGLALKTDFPEIEETVRIFPIDGTIAVKRDNTVFNEKGIYFVDPSFLRVFSYPLLKGDAATALSEPNTVVITAAAASKYFHTEDPIGKRLVLREGPMDIPVIVRGVMADVPENSHLDFDFLVSHATLVSAWGEQRANKSWGEAVFYTYILLKPAANIKAVEAKFPAFIARYHKLPANVQVTYHTQPLKSIHLHSDLVQEAKVNGSSKEVYFLLLIALFVMMIAWFNYINLSTARSIERAKEVGIRKVVGASRLQVFRQFIFESLLYNVLAIILALTILQLSQPLIIALTGKPLTFWSNTWLLLAIGVFFLGGAVISAIYPGLVLSAFRPIRVLKGKFTSSATGNRLRKGFTVMQFAACITLIIGTLTVYEQLSYMRNKDLGMNINQTLVLNNPDVVDSTFASRLQFFKNELAKHPGVKYVVSSTSIPGKTDNILKGGLMLAGSAKEAGSTHYGFQVDHHFMDAYEIKLLAGRNFSEDFGTDKEGMIVNQAALKVLGISMPDEAIGKKVATGWTNEKTIIGVVNDFHQKSLKSTHDPIVFVLDNSGKWGYYSVKLDITDPSKNSLPEVVAAIQNVWNQAFPGNPFDYFFADAYFDEQYKSDKRFGKVFALFACLAIFVACLGLFGLVTFTITQKTKEIGVRKVLGASLPDIVYLLSRDFMQLVLIANLIAWPISYWVMKKWLQNYAFQIDMQAWLFLLPSLLVIAIALITIIIQVVKAARANPVKALKYE